MMKIHVYSPIDWFEKWDWRNPDSQGIGGSETSHIEVCRRLAERGYEVTSYAPIPDDCPGEHAGVRWLPIEAADTSEPGIWLIYRSPESLDKFNGEGQHLWVVCQDIDYPGQWTEQRCKKAEFVFGLCPEHCRYLTSRYPEMRVVLWSNGIRTDLIRELLKGDLPERNPHRIMFASSPDRGLLNAVRVVNRAREWIPDLELHAYYGMARFDTAAEKGRKDLAAKKREIEAAMDQEGMFWHDKLPQRELYLEWMKAGIWLYPTSFTETSCITCMEAQALGAVPLTSPLWALESNVLHGGFIDGNPDNDDLTIARFVAGLVRLSDPALQDEIRPPMMFNAQRQFSWERIADSLESVILRTRNPETWPDDLPVTFGQYAFQHRHADGRIVNIGCNDDSSRFATRRAVNVDIAKVDQVTGHHIPVDVIADARELPESLHAKFDTAILGDILEHMTDTDIIRSLVSAKKCLENGGKVLVTWPVETEAERIRDHAISHDGRMVREYCEGVSHVHNRTITLPDMERLVASAGLRIEATQPIEYTDMTGWGLVCR